MARSFTQEQLDLLYSSEVKLRLLATFILDEGTYRFCDDPEDITAFGFTYIGASALAQASDIRSSAPYAAESVTITCDGTRLSEMGMSDPAVLFQMIITYLLSNRQVNLAWGLAYPESTDCIIVIPLYGGKINNVKITDPQLNFGDLTAGGAKATPQSKLVITLDSLAGRYQYNSDRLRAQQDQQEILPGDNFFAYVGSTVANQHNLYWGMKTPTGSQNGFGGVRPPGWVPSSQGYAVQIGRTGFTGIGNSLASRGI